MPENRAAFAPLAQRAVPYGPLPTFTLRRGRVSTRQADALQRRWPVLGVRVDGRPLDLMALFGRSSPVVLDVGSGMGEATALAAHADPARDVLAVDVHTPGLGNLLALAEDAGLTNLRMADGDVRVLLADMLAPGSLSEVRVWFPDPWPKTRHAKRRLLNPGFLAAVARALRPGGLLHVATDWPAYAEQVADLVAACPDLTLVSRDRPASRPTTRFERHGLAAGRCAQDLLALRHQQARH